MEEGRRPGTETEGRRWKLIALPDTIVTLFRKRVVTLDCRLAIVSCYENSALIRASPNPTIHDVTILLRALRQLATAQR